MVRCAQYVRSKAQSIFRSPVSLTSPVIAVTSPLSRLPDIVWALRIAFTTESECRGKETDTKMKSRGVRLGRYTMLVFFGIFIYLISATPPASAIPVFARKYGTSCSTCHNNFPELNDFGWAFYKNGFKFPKDDETFVKEPPVLLGAKAQKEAFPGNAIFPGEIPGTVPVGLRYEGFAQINSKQPAS